MDSEKMIMILTELLEDQKAIGRAQEEIIVAIAAMKATSEKIENITKDSVPADDNKLIRHCIENGFAELKMLIEITRQKATVNNLRVFLESDAKKWAVYLLVAITFLTYLYWFCMRK